MFAASLNSARDRVRLLPPVALSLNQRALIRKLHRPLSSVSVRGRRPLPPATTPSVDLVSEKPVENQKVGQIHFSIAIPIHPAIRLIADRPSSIAGRLVESQDQPREISETDRPISVDVRPATQIEGQRGERDHRNRRLLPIEQPISELSGFDTRFTAARRVKESADGPERHRSQMAGSGAEIAALRDDPQFQ